LAPGSRHAAFDGIGWRKTRLSEIAHPAWLANSLLPIEDINFTCRGYPATGVFRDHQEAQFAGGMQSPVALRGQQHAHHIGGRRSYYHQRSRRRFRPSQID
jgi:hypothetical protein